LSHLSPVFHLISCEKHWCHQCRCGFFRHDIHIYDISIFPDMTATFMSSVFFRHDIHIYDISVFFKWHLHSWYQCFSDIASTFITSVATGKLYYLWLRVECTFFCHLQSLAQTPAVVVYFYLTSTFMTSVFFRHHIYIDDISVFHMISNEKRGSGGSMSYICRWNGFHLIDLILFFGV
jgi:hypothetical protein